MAGERKWGRVKVVEDGPYLVTGNVPLFTVIILSDEEGTPVRWELKDPFPEKETYALCRCGQSRTKPFCDGTHARIGFDGTETASRNKYLEQAETISGPDLILMDAEKLCAVACFCHRGGDAWTLTENSDNPRLREMAIEEACACPSGRLVAWDKKTGKPIEPEFPPSINLIENPETKISGPIWVKGGLPIESADGTEYEIRNRVTLCRCGRSNNKPFCDGTHVAIGFKAGAEKPGI